MAKKIRTAGWLKRKLRRATRYRKRVDYRIYLPDAKYFLPPLKDIKEILARDHIDRVRWRPEVFDCDDFARVLDAEFAKTALTDTSRRYPYAAGRIYGLFPGPHAINWVFTDREQFYLIEPQTDGVFKLRSKPKRDKGIWLIQA